MCFEFLLLVLRLSSSSLWPSPPGTVRHGPSNHHQRLGSKVSLLDPRSSLESKISPAQSPTAKNLTVHDSLFNTSQLNLSIPFSRFIRIEMFNLKLICPSIKLFSNLPLHNMCSFAHIHLFLVLTRLTFGFFFANLS